MSHPVAQVRQDFAGRIDAISGAWNLSPVPWHQHGADGVPNPAPSTTLHLSFSVGVPQSEAAGNRQRSDVGAFVTTTVNVRFFARYDRLAGLASEDAMLGHEADLIEQVMDQSPAWPVHFKITRWVDSERTLIPTGEWYRVEVRFDVLHLISLT